MTFAGVDTAEQAEACGARVLRGRPLEDDDAWWVHELIGSEVVDTDGAPPGHGRGRGGQPRQRPPRARRRGPRPAAVRRRAIGRAGSCVDVPAGLARPARRRRAPTGAHRRLHDLPRPRRALLRGLAPRAGPGTQGLLDLRVHDLRGRGRATPGARSTTRPSAGAPAWCSPPGRSSPRSRRSAPPRPLYLLAPGGRRLDQRLVEELAATGPSRSGGFSLLCGRYEGVDQRVADHLVDGELSVGDYVLGGGEVPALVVVEAVARLVPGVMGNEASAVDESFSSRPARVPAVHPAGGVPGLGRARGPAERRPRPDRPVAPGHGPAPDAASCAPTSSRPAGGLADEDRRLLEEFVRRAPPRAPGQAAAVVRSVSGARLSWRARQALHGSAAPSPRWPRRRCPSRSELDL